MRVQKSIWLGGKLIFKRTFIPEGKASLEAFVERFKSELCREYPELQKHSDEVCEIWEPVDDRMSHSVPHDGGAIARIHSTVPAQAKRSKPRSPRASE